MILMIVSVTTRRCYVTNWPVGVKLKVRQMRSQPEKGEDANKKEKDPVNPVRKYEGAKQAHAYLKTHLRYLLMCTSRTGNRSAVAVIFVEKSTKEPGSLRPKRPTIFHCIDNRLLVDPRSKYRPLKDW